MPRNTYFKKSDLEYQVEEDNQATILVNRNSKKVPNFSVKARVFSAEKAKKIREILNEKLEVASG